MSQGQALSTLPSAVQTIGTSINDIYRFDRANDVKELIRLWTLELVTNPTGSTALGTPYHLARTGP
jgi:hypothetical protein